MEQIVTRGYKPGDEPRIVELWNRTLLLDPVTAKRFRNLVLLDANFDPEGMRLAFGEAGQLVGCVYAVRRLLPMSGTELEPDHGWIPFFFVDSAAERQGIGSRLLDEAEGFLRGLGRKKLFFASYAPNYIVPGIDATGYPKGESFCAKRASLSSIRPSQWTTAWSVTRSRRKWPRSNVKGRRRGIPSKRRRTRTLRN
ncbi:hypothetical protein HMSSN139_58170 [Paenibacillus sp. HMSSN-139]|nr:hypothetical protein HMSSN139_58170 [Paenibacillus sp. HMSSN-139]